MKLLTHGSSVVGVQYEFNGKRLQEHGPVILCTGGYGADFSSGGLLDKYRPELMHLPTTSGDHATGDGIKLGQAVGGAVADMEWIQVNPTALVKPDDADAKLKFSGAEVLRGVGGILLNAAGARFVNELGKFSDMTNEMWANKGPFRLVLGSKAAAEIIWHCDHYVGRGVMAKMSGADLAKEIGVPPESLQATLAAYNTAAEKLAGKEPAPYAAHGGGKTWDKFGKKFFPNGPLEMDDEFHVAVVTPAIHYCMGGLQINVNGNVVDAQGKAIQGLYAAGEVTGGVHGKECLGGNALLDCVVFGRVAAKACTKFMLGEVERESLAELSGKLSGGTVVVAGGDDDDDDDDEEDAGGGGITVEEVAAHNTATDCWVIVNNKVIDVTAFLKTHPGGEAAIMAFAGKDASVEWNMIHAPNFLDVHVPDKILGEIGGKAKAGVAAPAPAAPAGAPTSAPAASGGADAPLLEKEEEAEPGVLKIWASAIGVMAFSWIRELIKSIFSGGNFVLSFKGERAGLARSALFLVFFILIHALGNTHIFLGPDDFNGYGHMFVRLYWTGFGLQMNIVEEYLLLAALLHIMVALRRTWDINMGYTLSSGKLNLAITGVLLIIYMSIHLTQFRLADTHNYRLRPPPYYVNLNVTEWPHLFATMDPNVPFVDTRDIYRLEFELFSGNYLISFYYICMVMTFCTHMMIGWAKVVPSSQFDIPSAYQPAVIKFGYGLCALIGITYTSFPLYCILVGPSDGMYGPQY
jgi:hypothetical protein